MKEIRKLEIYQQNIQIREENARFKKIKFIPKYNLTFCYQCPFFIFQNPFDLLQSIHPAITTLNFIIDKFNDKGKIQILKLSYTIINY